MPFTNIDPGIIEEGAREYAEKMLKRRLEKHSCRYLCKNCGRDVKLEVKIGGEWDMMVKVPVCECAKENPKEE